MNQTRQILVQQIIEDFWSTKTSLGALEDAARVSAYCVLKRHIEGEAEGATSLDRMLAL